MPEEDDAKKEAPDVEKALSFFRIFDLAFFLPGFVLYRFSFAGVPLAAIPAPQPLANSTAVLDVVTLIAASYVLGLLTHAIARLVKALSAISIEKLFPALSKASAPSWTAKAGKRLQGDLRGYFWYTRAVCINLAVAAVAVGCTQSGMIALGSFVAAFALLLLHFDFDRALKGI